MLQAIFNPVDIQQTTCRDKQTEKAIDTTTAMFLFINRVIKIQF